MGSATIVEIVYAQRRIVEELYFSKSGRIEAIYIAIATTSRIMSRFPAVDDVVRCGAELVATIEATPAMDRASPTVLTMLKRSRPISNDIINTAIGTSVAITEPSTVEVSEKPKIRAPFLNIPISRAAINILAISPFSTLRSLLVLPLNRRYSQCNQAIIAVPHNDRVTIANGVIFEGIIVLYIG